MLIQLVASERGIAALPDWVVAEYEKKGWVTSRPLGEGVYCQLYAATREDSRELAYVQGFSQPVIRYGETNLTGTCIID